MTERETESGIEVVLDNRKIILAFVIFIAICGGFFVLGFMEGKRQGHQAGMQAAAEVGTMESPAAVQAQLPETETVQAPEVPESDAEDQPLNWYKSVNRKEGEPEIAPRATTSGSNKPNAKAAAAANTPGKPKAQTSPARAGSMSYTVQVGAFVKREEAEVRAKELRSKGFEYRIEPPAPPSEFYFVKVGAFETRAEAVAMQIRLKESGFACFIKTN